MAIPPNERNCLACAHCRVSVGESDWSDVTPGEAGSIVCYKSHFMRIYDEGDVRKKLFTLMDLAKTCPDYEEDI